MELQELINICKENNIIKITYNNISIEFETAQPLSHATYVNEEPKPEPTKPLSLDEELFGVVNE